jgi:hypothetical protein
MCAQVCCGWNLTVAVTRDGHVFQMGGTGASNGDEDKGAGGRSGAAWEGCRLPTQVEGALFGLFIEEVCVGLCMFVCLLTTLPHTACAAVGVVDGLRIPSKQEGTTPLHQRTVLSGCVLLIHGFVDHQQSSVCRRIMPHVPTALHPPKQHNHPPTPTPTRTPTPTPTPAPTSTSTSPFPTHICTLPHSQVSVGMHHVAAVASRLQTNGRLAADQRRCRLLMWGRGRAGQLGNGMARDHNMPQVGWAVGGWGLRCGCA